ncbi:ArnT family glycosyltransferase [Polaribacter sargassicola]|uniref:ArnT family glycosyltransferase n=1 Tax=Polaribacter sargassicola TaxID=2836891 RepID=UPI001F2FA200|nr:glycosyltransferase family 39 protein [Polaribacter sp. DS7-9]
MLIIIVTILGLPLDLINPDAALYATISKTIFENNDFINLYSLGYDWLDKPHLPFWLTAISYKIFGVSNFAYKIPGVLVFFLGIWMTYKFTKENYNKKTAFIAAIILATATHSVISNFDVRAEPYLTGFIIASLYYSDRFLKLNKLYYLILACLFAAFAIMTKGIFALIPIIFALLGELVVKRNWKQLLNPVWFLAAFLIFIFIIPELYSLYLQFDLHPEKIVFDKNNTSGIQFFFWDSQFGRFFNTAPIKGSGDKFFFFHTILWAFLPWGIIFYIASFFKIKQNLKKVIQKEEFYTIFGSLFTILIFSLSKFQLAHYTNIIFPFMAIIVANFIYKLEVYYKNVFKSYRAILWFQNIVGLLLMIYLFVVIKPKVNYLFFVVIIISLLIYVIIKKSNEQKSIKLFFFSSLIFLTIYSFLLTHFYPTILEYQGGVTAAKFVNKNYPNQGSLIDNKEKHFGFEFYLKDSLKRVDSLQISKEKGRIFFVDKNEYQLLLRQNVNFKVIKEVDNFRVSKINSKFLNSNTRPASLSKKYLVEIQ